MSSNTTSAFRFMPEIEDQIFELAAHISPESAVNLSVVSKRAQQRVEPIIYKTIVFISLQERFILRNMIYFEKFMVALKSRPARFFAMHVHNVCITNTVPKDIATLILAKCTGIQKLALWYRNDYSNLNIMKMITPLSSTLRSLSTGRKTLHQLAKSGYVFSHVLHLDIGVLPVDMRIPGLEWLPALTTVQMDLGQQPFVDDEWIKDVKIALYTAQQLQVLRLCVSESCVSDVETGIDSEGLDDERIMVQRDSLPDPIAEWMEAP